MKRFSRNNRHEYRGDILIRGLWARGTNCILDVRDTDVDAKSNRSKDPCKVSAAHERERKKKFLEACLIEQCRHFSPFVVSTDGGLLLRRQGNEDLAEETITPARRKVGETLLRSLWICHCTYRMSIAIVRAIYLCLRGSAKCAFRSDWEDKAGLGLLRR